MIFAVFGLLFLCFGWNLAAVASFLMFLTLVYLEKNQ